MNCWIQDLTINGFSKLVEDYESYTNKVLSKDDYRKIVSTYSWACPSDGIVKINVDADVISDSHVG